VQGLLSRDGTQEKRLTIAANALSQVVGGGLTVAQHLVRELARARPTWRFVVFTTAADLIRDAPPNVEIECLPSLRAVVRRLAWEQLRLPAVLERRGVDVVLGLGGFATYRTSVPQVAVWQNALIWSRAARHPSVWARGYIAVQQVLLRMSMARAALNVFPTQHAADEVSARWPSLAGRRCSIHFGLPNSGSAPADGRTARDPFVLAVGDVYFHKNYDVLVKAIAEYRAHGGTLRLKIAGRFVDARCHAQLEALITDLRLKDAVDLLGPVAPERVRALYRSATAFVTASRVESFGFTPLEAMAEGLPVLAARASGTPEVCGAAAAYFDPASPKALAELLRDVELRPEVQDRLRRAGLSRAAEFSWRATAEAYARALAAAADRV
jgi:glycosyltransferase involved in cell wall biosynthesis